MVHESKTESTPEAIAGELAKAPSCRRIVFETGRMAPILFHGLNQLGLPVVFQIDFDPLDVPRDRFLVGGDAWRAYRSGADPMTFGVAGTANWGVLEIYGDLFQDLAALQKVELLPWNWYGLALNQSGLAETDLLDDLARISSQADADSLARLNEKLAADERLRVPVETIADAREADRARLA
jgi:hypothetical protein